MSAIEVFFSGTPQQLANAVNSLVGSRLLPETGRMVFDVKREDLDSVLIEVQTPEDIPHVRGVTMHGAYIAEIEAHTVPAGTYITLRAGLCREYDPVALHWWEALLAQLCREGWRVWTAGEAVQTKVSWPKSITPRISDQPNECCKWNTEVIRDLLNAAFGDEDLTTFCFDYFRPVYDDFALGMSKGQKVQRLLDYCERREQVEALLAAVCKANPKQYQRFEVELAG